jgi:hypothetical protein
MREALTGCGKEQGFDAKAGKVGGRDQTGNKGGLVAAGKG